MCDKALILVIILLASAYTYSVNGQALSTDNFFLLADTSQKNVYHINYTTGTTNELLEHDQSAQPFAVAYDPTTAHFYWSDLAYNWINRRSLLTRYQNRVYQDPSSKATIEGLAINSDNQELYYTDRYHGQVAVISTNGTNHRILVNAMGSKPGAIVYDSVNRMVYWTDWNADHPGIYRSPAQDPSRTALITTDIKWPNALAIDFSVGKMYWGDAYLGKIEIANLDGSQRLVLVNETAANSQYSAFALDSTYLYITVNSTAKRYIRRMRRTSLELSTYRSSQSLWRANGLVRYVAANSTAQPTDVENIVTTADITTTIYNNTASQTAGLSTTSIVIAVAIVEILL